MLQIVSQNYTWTLLCGFVRNYKQDELVPIYDNKNNTLSLIIFYFKAAKSADVVGVIHIVGG